MKERLVVKVGSSIITDGNVIVQERVNELCKFIALIRQKFDVILVSSGAVASGFTKIQLDKSKIENKQALASIGQPLLMETYRKSLESYGIIPAQFLLVGSSFDSRKRTKYAKNTIEILLSNGVLPIINENDSVTQGELIFGDFGDNDRLGAYSTHYFNAPMLVVLSDVYGYFDSNPLENANAKLVKFVKSINQRHFYATQIAGSNVGTGGIVTKLMAADFLLHNNKSMFLCNGFDLAPTIEFLMEGKHTQGTLFSRKQGVDI